MPYLHLWQSAPPARSVATRPRGDLKRSLGDPRMKTGPGTRRTAQDVTGPDRFVPLINSQSQSARSNQATFGVTPITGREDTNARLVSRESLALPSAYGQNLGTAVP